MPGGVCIHTCIHVCICIYRLQGFYEFIQGHTISEGSLDMQIQAFTQYCLYLNNDTMTIIATQLSNFNMHTNH